MILKTKEDCFHLGVKALIRNPNKEILLLERNPKHNKIYWDLPGGRLQKGESPLETLRREVMEEIGLDYLSHVQPFITVLTDMRIRQEDDDVGLIFSIYLCNIHDFFSPQLSDEHIGFKWMLACDCVQELKQYPIQFTEKLAKLL